MTKTYDTTRRGALQLFGASAAILTPTTAFAAYDGRNSLLNLKKIPLAWPLYHRIHPTSGAPVEGQNVVLERDIAHPSGARGIAVHLTSGETLGFVTNQHHAALDWAMQNGGAIEANIAIINEPIVAGQRVPGWGAYHIDVTVQKKAAFV